MSRKFVLVPWALGGWSLAAALALSASLAFSSPRVVSNEIAEVSYHLFTETAVNNQSGERVVIDALLFDEAAEADGTLMGDNFSLLIPNPKEGARFCVDLASRTASFRRMAIYKLTKPVQRVSAHLDLSDTNEIGPGGAVMVAYSTEDMSENPLEACLLQDDWIYPARHSSAAGSNDLILQFRLNSGNGTSTVVQVNNDNVAVGKPVGCTREQGKNGLFDRVCRLKLLPTPDGIARIKTKIRQRTGLPLERIFHVAVDERSP